MQSMIKKSLTFKEYLKRLYAYHEASAPIKKQQSRLISMAIPKIVYINGMLKIQDDDKVNKIISNTNKILKNLHNQIILKGGN